MNVVNSVNLSLGLSGLAVSSGLLLMTRWGFWGTVVISALTIVFDGTSAFAVSVTAVAGLILPVIFLVVLVPKRRSYFVLHFGHE
jgi:hypothetical protein